MNISFHEFVVFFIAFTRIATILAVLPIFGFNGTPSLAKAGMSFLITMVLFPLVSQGDFVIPIQLLPFIIMILKEVIVGLIIGFTANFLFVGIQYAGELIGLDIGFGIVNIVDPQSGEQVSIIGEFLYVISILLFLIFNGHHFFLEGLNYSFEVIPINTVEFSEAFIHHMIKMSSNIFMIALKIGGPILVATFTTSFVMGIIARTVPQMNIFIVGFPLKIAVGFIMLISTMPFFVFIFEKLYHLMQNDISNIIKMMSSQG